MTLALLLAACAPEEAGEEGLVRQALGSFTTDDAGEVDVAVESPEGAVSTLVYCGPYGYETLATAVSITDPSGTRVYDMDAPNDGHVRVSVLDDLLPMLVPVSPDLDLTPGVWTYRLLVDAAALPATVSCNAVSRVQAAASTATVDLHLVYLTDGLGLTASSAPGDTALDAALATLEDLWAEAGLALGEISDEDFDGDEETYRTIETDQEFGDLLRTVPDNGARAVTFFFVEDLEFGDGASVLGLAGGPPGAASVGGTSKSGVVVNAADYAQSPEEIGLIMAHEGGHFLGLFHPTEKDGSGFDPLDDTPRCEVSDGRADDECVGQGDDNVMWWSAAVGTAEHYTSDQAWVVNRSAAAH